MLAAGDTFRAAAIEQLKVWAERTGAGFVAQQAGADPGAVVFDALQSARARGSDVLLADTAGRLHSQSHLMEELKKVKRVIQRVDPSAPHEVLLVLDANQGQNALAQAQPVQRGGGRHGTGAHQARRHRQGRHRGGDRAQLGLPIRFIGVGEAAEDFGEFDAEAFASRAGRGAGSRAPRRRRMIVFDRVSKRYPNGREALTNVSFEIHTGEMVFLTGRSGAGKSTVLKLIALLERPTRGTVLVNGQNTSTLKARHIPAFRRHIGVVFQDHKLLADRPVFDNVALPLVVAGTPLKEIDKRVRAALDQVGLLGKERVLPLELSVGRAAACRHRPRGRQQAAAADRRRAHRQPRPGPRAGGHAAVPALPGRRRHGGGRHPRPAPGARVRPARASCSTNGQMHGGTRPTPLPSVVATR